MIPADLGVWSPCGRTVQCYSVPRCDVDYHGGCGDSGWGYRGGWSHVRAMQDWPYLVLSGNS